MGVINRTAGIIGMVGGLLLTLSGAVGMVSTLEFLRGVLERTSYLNSDLEMVFTVLIFFATLGGVSVLIGAFLIYKDIHRIGKVLVILGMGVGLVGLIIQMFLAYKNGTLSEFKAWLTSSLQGIGILLSIICTKLA